MKLIIISLGLFMIGLGIAALIYPENLYGLLEANLDNPTLYFGAIIGRLAFGLLLVKMAKESKHPMVIKIIGFIAIIAAISFILIGSVGFQNFVSSLIPVFKPYGRIVALFTIAFGSFLIYTFLEEKKLGTTS